MAEWSCVSAPLAAGYSALAFYAERSASCHSIIAVNSMLQVEMGLEPCNLLFGSNVYCFFYVTEGHYKI